MEKLKLYTHKQPLHKQADTHTYRKTFACRRVSTSVQTHKHHKCSHSAQIHISTYKSVYSHVHVKPYTMMYIQISVMIDRQIDRKGHIINKKNKKIFFPYKNKKYCIFTIHTSKTHNNFFLLYMVAVNQLTCFNGSIFRMLFLLKSQK